MIPSLRQLERLVDERIRDAQKPFLERLDMILDELRKLNAVAESGGGRTVVDRGSSRRSLRKDVAGRN